jgi:hypothetical protein
MRRSRRTCCGVEGGIVSARGPLIRVGYGAKPGSVIRRRETLPVQGRPSPPLSAVAPEGLSKGKIEPGRRRGVTSRLCARTEGCGGWRATSHFTVMSRPSGVDGADVFEGHGRELEGERLAGIERCRGTVRRR